MKVTLNQEEVKLLLSISEQLKNIENLAIKNLKERQEVDNVYNNYAWQYGFSIGTCKMLGEQIELIVK